MECGNSHLLDSGVQRVNCLASVDQGRSAEEDAGDENEANGGAGRHGEWCAKHVRHATKHDATHWLEPKGEHQDAHDPTLEFRFYST